MVQSDHKLYKIMPFDCLLFSFVFIKFPFTNSVFLGSLLKLLKCMTIGKFS